MFNLKTALLAASLTQLATAKNPNRVHKPKNYLNHTAIHSMVKTSCQGDPMCMKLMTELEDLSTKSLALGRRMNTDSGDRLSYLRRLRDMKSMILHLQPEHRFARYCYYGCWCLPDPSHSLETPGKGPAVDSVDASCKRQNHCYECAKMDHLDHPKECRPDVTSYKYRLHNDPMDPDNHWKKSIECLDEATKKMKPQHFVRYSCSRALCECDKKMAEDLRAEFHEWNTSNKQSEGFDKHSVCVNKGPGGRSGPLQCCGKYPNRYPYASDGGYRDCCGQKTYSIEAYECCDGEKVGAVGTCS